jgi:hypothetical protein
VTGTLLDTYGAAADLDDADEDELIGVSINDTSYIPRSLLKRMGYKLTQNEETKEWEAVAREGAEEVCVRVCWGGAAVPCACRCWPACWLSWRQLPR